MGCEKSVPVVQLEKALAPLPTAEPFPNRPHARFQLRTLCLIGALLPGDPLFPLVDEHF